MKMAFFLFIFFSYSLFAQTDSSIAEVGNLDISLSEFKIRFELTPQVTRPNIAEIDSKKKAFLYSLIAEKLWALEAEQRHLDTLEIMQTTFQQIEKMFVQDALYRNEIASKVEVSEEELLNGMEKYFTDLEVSVIHSTDSADIFMTYNSLNDGAKFDSLYNLQSFPLPDILISFGEMKPDAETELYDLSTGSFSKPIKSNSGWFIFKIKNRIERSYTSEDIDQSLKKVERIIEKRKTEKYYDQFITAFLKGKKVNVNGSIFWTLNDKISDYLSAKKSKDKIADTSTVYIKGEDLLLLENDLNEKLDSNFIEFKNNPITLGEFLRFFSFDGFYTGKTDKETIAAKLNSRVKTFIENELLSREAYRRGLQNNSTVKDEIKIWRENYLAKILKNILVDSLSRNTEVTDIKNEPDDSVRYELNIIEILTDSLSVVEKVLNELNAGADIKILADKYNQREETKQTHGEYGFFPEGMHSDIGRIAAQLDVGDVYGPLKVNEGYSVVKLIGKKEINEGTSANSGSSNEEKLLQKKQELMHNYFIEFTSKLAIKFNVQIDYNLLKNISLKDFKMYTIRQFGFGGTLPAVPLTIPFSEWAPQWLHMKKENP